MYFHVYLIYRFTRTFTDHSSVITRCWGFELQNGKSSLKSPQTLATQGFAPASFLSTPDTRFPIAWSGATAIKYTNRHISVVFLQVVFPLCRHTIQVSLEIPFHVISPMLRAGALNIPLRSGRRRLLLHLRNRPLLGLYSE